MPRQKTNCNCKRASVAWGFSCQCCIYGFTIKQPLGKKKCLGFSIFQAREWGITPCRTSCWEEGKRPWKRRKSQHRSLMDLVGCKTPRRVLPASRALSGASRASHSVAGTVHLLLWCHRDLHCSRTCSRSAWPTRGVGRCVVMQDLYSHHQDRFGSAGFYAAKALQADTKQGSLNWHTPCFCPAGQRLSFVSVDPPADCFQARRTGAFGHWVGFLHKAKPSAAVYKEPKSEGHRNLCLEAVSALICVGVSWGCAGEQGPCRSWALLMLLGAPRPSSRWTRNNQGIVPRGTSTETRVWWRRTPGWLLENPRYVVCCPSCILLFDLLQYPLGFSKLAPHPPQKNKV